MTEQKKYAIRNFEQLLNVVNMENIQNLAVDLSHWLIHYAVTIKKIKEAHPKETENKTNWEIMQGGFDWIDDGKNDLIGTEVTNQKTGEVKYFKHKGMPK